MSGEDLVRRRVLLPFIERLRIVFHYSGPETHEHFEVTRHNPHEHDVILCRTRDSIGLGVIVACENGITTALRIEERYRVTLPGELELLSHRKGEVAVMASLPHAFHCLH